MATLPLLRPKRRLVLSRNARTASNPASAANMSAMPVNAPVGVSVTQIKGFAENWVREGLRRGLSPKTVQARKFTTGKYVWYLEQEAQTSDAAGKEAVEAFLLYVETGHERTGGRWGKRGSGGKKENKGKAQPGTVLTYYLRLKGFFNFCVNEGYLPASPMAKIKAPVNRQDEIQPFSASQVNALLHAASETVQPLRNKAILLMMYDTGVRAAELCGLKRADVEIIGSTGTITVLGKGKKKRSVPLQQKATAALKRYLADANPKPHEPLFFAWSETGSRNALTPAGLLQLYERLGKAAGITNLRCSPHTMRHTFAITYLRNGGDPLTLQTLLGHNDLKTTRRYLAFTQSDIENQHRKASPADNLNRQ